jgi:hypothetical protein
MPTKLEEAVADLETKRDRLNTAIDALRGIIQDDAASAPPAPPERRRPGRPRKNAAAPDPKARAAKAPKKAALPKKRAPRGSKKPAAPKLEPRIEEYFAADTARESTALEIGQALGADHRAVRLSLGRMAKKNKATKLEGGLYRAYSG